MILRYVNPNDETILAKVTWSHENPYDAEQSYLVCMEPTREPKIVTVKLPDLPATYPLRPSSIRAAGRPESAPTPGAHIKQNKLSVKFKLNFEHNELHEMFQCLLGLLASLPAAYYEAPILQEQVLRPCLAGDHEEGTGSCRHFSYPSLSAFVNVRGEGAFVALEDERRHVFLAIDPRVRPLSK
jgi:hypothetical protein